MQSIWSWEPYALYITEMPTINLLTTLYLMSRNFGTLWKQNLFFFSKNVNGESIKLVSATAK